MVRRRDLRREHRYQPSSADRPHDPPGRGGGQLTADRLADYPTLAIDDEAIYVGFNDFISSTGGLAATSAFSIPKADILASTPSAANRSTSRSDLRSPRLDHLRHDQLQHDDPRTRVLIAVDFLSFGRIPSRP